jgi:hypothetical protein
MAETKAEQDDELDRLATEIFEQQVRPRLHPEDAHKFLAIDLKTGDFQVDEDDYTAVMSLRARHPDGEIWLMQSDGSPAFFMGLSA